MNQRFGTPARFPLENPDSTEPFAKYGIGSRRAAASQAMAVMMNPITMIIPKIMKSTYVQLIGRRRGGLGFAVFEYISSPRTGDYRISSWFCSANPGRTFTSVLRRSSTSSGFTRKPLAPAEIRVYTAVSALSTESITTGSFSFG
jgi:hypothetical protein